MMSNTIYVHMAAPRLHACFTEHHKLGEFIVALHVSCVTGGFF